jgi:hypothetical protein
MFKTAGFCGYLLSFPNRDVIPAAAPGTFYRLPLFARKAAT